jgi:hypothetical protein
MNMLALPPELLHELLLRLDPPTRRALAHTCRAMRDAVDKGDALWRELLERRFRTRAPTFRAPAAPRQPRDVYVQWHRQQRPPASRLTSAATALFAKTTTCQSKQGHKTHAAEACARRYAPDNKDKTSAMLGKHTAGRPIHDHHPQVLVWATVKSADDCRVGPHGLVLRVVVQNIGIAPINVATRHISITLTTGRKLQPWQSQWAHFSGSNSEQGQHHQPPCDHAASQPLLPNVHSCLTPVGSPGSSANPRDLPRRALAHHQAFMPILTPANIALSSPNRDEHHLDDHPHNQERPAAPSSAIPSELTIVEDDFIIDRVADFISAGNRRRDRGHIDATSRTTPTPLHATVIPDRIRLLKDDFFIMHVQVRLAGVVHEVDAVEQLDWIGIPVWEEFKCEGIARANFDERVLWERYELMPGGWWVRKEMNTLVPHR